mmetsp:Transcript_7973/g.8989  ORF Transcript_7973/g.8989 Transcript_7973/m.8989 type:complete len:333 (+) Transcript_7973:16-1014(+)
MSLHKTILLLFLAFTQLLLVRSIHKELCKVIQEGKDVECDIEYGSFIEASSPLPNKTSLKILEFNVDKSGYGGDSPLEKGYILIMNYLQLLVEKEDIDVIIFAEIARDCPRWGNGVHTVVEIAKLLKASYIYGVEFYLPSQSSSDYQCTIGNAIISRYNLENASQIVFKNQIHAYANQVGNRQCVYGDIQVDGKSFRIYSAHLESGNSEISSVIGAFGVRKDQMKEIVDHTNQGDQKYEYIIAGDFNSPLAYLDYGLSDLYLNGFFDSHRSMWFFNRATCPFSPLDKYYLSVLDYIFAKNRNNFENAKIYNDKDEYYGLSDHLPISVAYKLR